MMSTNHATVDTGHGILDIYWTDDDVIMTWRDTYDDAPVEIDLPSREIRAKRVRRVLGDYRFNPYDRNPTDVEIESLEADGILRELFKDEE